MGNCNGFDDKMKGGKIIWNEKFRILGRMDGEIYSIKLGKKGWKRKRLLVHLLFYANDINWIKFDIVL